MARLLVSILLSSLVGLAGCSTIRVTHDYDSDTDFSQYRSYRWLKQEENVPPARRAEHSLLEKRVKAAVDGALMERGYYEASGAKPDFLVAWHIGAQDKVNVERYGYRYGPRGRWYGTDVRVHHYKEGTLILDFIDPADKILVWRSTAVGTMRDLAEGESEVQSTVDRMLKKFPPD